MQQLAGDSPSLIIVERADRAAPASGLGVGGGELVGVCPSDEGDGLVAVAAGGVALPAFEFGLSEGVQGEVVGVEPVEECLGCAAVQADAQSLLSGSAASVVSAPQPSEQVPNQVAVQDLSAGRILLRGKEIGERLFRADEFLVALGQGADRDQCQAQMLKDGLLATARQSVDISRTA